MELRPDAYRDFGDSCAGVYPPDEFEGLWIEHWPNCQLKFRGMYRKLHKRVGQHICFWENGVLQEVSFWSEGWACGMLLRFRQNGSKEYEKDYGADGGRTRSWTDRAYDTDSVLYAITVWKDGDIVSEWLEPESNRRRANIGFDDIVADAIREVYPDQ